MLRAETLVYCCIVAMSMVIVCHISKEIARAFFMNLTTGYFRRLPSAATKKTPEAIKTYRKATIVDVKSLLGRFLDERLKDLEK